MINKGLIISLFLWFSNMMSAQELSSNVQSFISLQEIIYKADRINLENRINRLIQKNKQIEMSNSLKQFHIYFFEMDGSLITVQDYRDGKFLRHLNPILYSPLQSKRFLRKKEKYLWALSLITDSLGNIVAFADNEIMYTINNINIGYQRIAKMFFNKEIDFAFLFRSDIKFYICIKETELFVLNDSEENLKRMSWEEFINTYIIYGFPKERTTYVKGRPAG